MFNGERKIFRRLRQELRQTLKINLLMGFGIWFGLLPLFQLTHILFANHNHIYCAEHHQIEDVVLAPDRATEGLEQPHYFPNSVQPSLLKGSARLTQSHLACLVLNQGSLRDPAIQSQAQSPIPCNLVANHAAGALKFIPATCSLFLIAPKHSPPSAAC